MKSKIFKSTVLVVSLGFLMSATKCQQPAAPVETRQLKKNIKVLQMSASSFMDSPGFSFSEVAQSQLSGVFFEKNYFYERNNYPTPEDIISAASDVKFYKVSNASGAPFVVRQNKTVTQLKKWFPDLKTQDVKFSQDSSCLISRPQHYITGKINSLEAYSGASLQLGFNQTSVVPIPVSGHIKIDKMRMDLSFHAFDPWTQQIVNSQNAEAFKKDYAAGFGVDLGIIHIGPEFYRTTGMSETVLKGLETGISQLGNALLATPNQDWHTRVMYSGDSKVVLVGGAELGIRRGDTFKVYNQVHNWIGSPCGESSMLNGSTIISDVNDPWIVQIEDAGDLMSTAKVLNPKENTSIQLGALVKLDKFAVPASADQTPAK